MRLDRYLAERGLLPSRSKARTAIAEGLVAIGGAVCRKPSAEVDDGDEVIVAETNAPVSRGGYKLSAALDEFMISPLGRICLDIGASTGGFTECLLRRGAVKVYALDVGHGQLHGSLRSDPRVIDMEGVNARSLSPSLIEPISLASMDVSFISQRLLYAPLISVLAPNADVIALIKPQFEVGPGHLNRKGIVRDERERRRAIDELRAIAAESGLACKGIVPSPITGGDGNAEYLAHFIFEANS